jgi:hypothetical protein
MVSFRLVSLAAALWLSASAQGWAAAPAQCPLVRAEAANLVLAYLKLGQPPRTMSTPVKPVAASCKDKCEDDRDRCFNACPSDTGEASVCRNDCSDVYDTCLKGC